MNEFKKNKFQILFVDYRGNYQFLDFISLKQAYPKFRLLISRSDCLLCDLRFCGSLESVASYKNYKYLPIEGE